jgi:hypothetical protein
MSLGPYFYKNSLIKLDNLCWSGLTLQLVLLFPLLDYIANLLILMTTYSCFSHICLFVIYSESMFLCAYWMRATFSINNFSYFSHMCVFQKACLFCYWCYYNIIFYLIVFFILFYFHYFCISIFWKSLFSRISIVLIFFDLFLIICIFEQECLLFIYEF